MASVDNSNNNDNEIGIVTFISNNNDSDNNISIDDDDYDSDEIHPPTNVRRRRSYKGRRVSYSTDDIKSNNADDDDHKLAAVDDVLLINSTIDLSLNDVLVATKKKPRKVSINSKRSALQQGLIALNDDEDENDIILQSNPTLNSTITTTLMEPPLKRPKPEVTEEPPPPPQLATMVESDGFNKRCVLVCEDQVYQLGASPWNVICPIIIQEMIEECAKYKELTGKAPLKAQNGTLTLFRHMVKQMKRELAKQNQSCKGMQKLQKMVDAIDKAAGCKMIKWSIRIYKEGRVTTRHFDSASYQYRLLSSQSVDGIDPNFLDLYLFLPRKREDNTIESEHQF